MMNALVGKKCSGCGFSQLEPGFSCPSCGGEELNSIQFSGEGSIYTFTVVMVGFGHLASRAPYVLAIVELKEGLKVLTVVEDMKPEDAAIGKLVYFNRIEEGTGPIFHSK